MREAYGQTVQELDELTLPYIFDVKAYEIIHQPSLKPHIDEFGKILYGIDNNVLTLSQSVDCPEWRSVKFVKERGLL